MGRRRSRTRLAGTATPGSKGRTWMRTVLRWRSRQLRWRCDEATSAFSNVAGRLFVLLGRIPFAVSTAAFPLGDNTFGDLVERIGRGAVHDRDDGGLERPDLLRQPEPRGEEIAGEGQIGQYRGETDDLRIRDQEHAVLAHSVDAECGHALVEPWREVRVNGPVPDQGRGQLQLTSGQADAALPQRPGQAPFGAQVLGEASQVGVGTVDVPAAVPVANGTTAGAHGRLLAVRTASTRGPRMLGVSAAPARMRRPVMMVAADIHRVASNVPVEVPGRQPAEAFHPRSRALQAGTGKSRRSGSHGSATASTPERSRPPGARGIR